MDYAPVDVAAKCGFSTRQFRRYLSEAAERGVSFPGVQHRGHAGARPIVIYNDTFLAAFESYLAQRGGWDEDAQIAARADEDDDDAPTTSAVSPDAQALIDILRRTTELPLSDLADRLDCSPRRIHALIQELADAHYHVVCEEEAIALRRTVVPQSSILRPNWSGASTQTFGVVSDIHLCNRHSKVQSLRHAYEYMAERGCSFVLNVGDVLDGAPSMHKGFEFDLGISGMDEQVDYATDVYPRDLPTIFVAGNHDLSWYRTAGANVVRQLCARNPTSWRYAGAGEAFLPGPDGRPNFIYLKHPGDGGSYARSYRLQKTNEWLHDAVNDVAVDLEKRTQNLYPKLVFLGHYHKYCHVRGPYSSHCFTVPSLCGMTAFQYAKSLYNELGFMLATAVFDDNGEMVGLTWELKDVFGGDEEVFTKEPPKRVLVSMGDFWG
jgi:predicted phosphodiesterase